MDATNKPLMLV